MRLSVIVTVLAAAGVMQAQTAVIFDPLNSHLTVSYKPIIGGNPASTNCVPGVTPILYNGGGYYGCTGTNTFTLFSTGSAAAFGTLTGGTNSGAAMVITTGASLTFSASGTINATSVSGSAIGTSGATIPLNNANNTFAGNLTLSGTDSITGTLSTSSAGTINFGTATATSPMALATADPATCGQGQFYFNTSSLLTKVCTATNAWSSLAGGITALTTDVVASGTGSVVATIQPGVVTLAKMANETASTILGNVTVSPAAPQALTGTQVISLLPTCGFSGVGTVPQAPNNTTSFLRGDCTFATPAGGGTVTVQGGGNLTSGAVVTGAGTQVVQTPSATTTLDSSGNLSTPGQGSFGVGSGNAGGIELTQGTAQTPGTTAILLQAPSSVTSYNIVMPGTAATGFFFGSNSAGTITMSYLADPLVVAHGGTGLSTISAHGVLLGEGTSNVATAAPSGNGQCFMSQAASGTTTDPSFQACPSSSTPSFSVLTTGTNSTATMTVGTGGTLTFSGSGVVNANQLNGTAFAGTNGDVVTFGAANIPADSGFLATNVVLKSAANIGAAAMTLNMAASTGTNAFRTPAVASLACSANGCLGFEATNLQTHDFTGGNDSLVVTVPASTTIIDGRCMQWSKPSSTATAGVASAACGSGGGGGTAGSPLFVQTSSASAVTSNSATTVIGTGVGSLTIPANWFTSAGTVMEICHNGLLTTAASSPGTMQFKLLFGATTVAQTAAYTPSTSLSNSTMSVCILLTARTVGTSGTILVNQVVNTTGATVTTLNDPQLTNPTPGTAVTVNTTTTQVVDFQITFSANATNSYTGLSFVMYGPGSAVSSVNGGTGAITGVSQSVGTLGAGFQAQSAAVASANLATAPAAGKYRFSAYLEQVQACTTLTASQPPYVWATFTWVDDTGNTITWNSPPLTMTATSGTMGVEVPIGFPIRVASGNVTAATTVSGSCATGTAQYSLYASLFSE